MVQQAAARTPRPLKTLWSTRAVCLTPRVQPGQRCQRMGCSMYSVEAMAPRPLRCRITNPSHQSWSVGPSMPVSVEYVAGAALSDGDIMAIGGLTSEGTESTAVEASIQHLLPGQPWLRSRLRASPSEPQREQMVTCTWLAGPAAKLGVNGRNSCSSTIRRPIHGRPGPHADGPWVACRCSWTTREALRRRRIQREVLHEIGARL